MKLIIRLNLMLLAGILVQILSSCKHEGEYDHADITVYYSCTKDVLDFFTPVVRVTNSDGTRKEIVLDDKDFFEHTDNNVFNFETSSELDIKAYYCPINGLLEGMQGNYRLTVKFIPKTDLKDVTEGTYHFADNFSRYTVDLKCQNGHLILKYNTNISSNVLDDETNNDMSKIFYYYSIKTSIFDLAYTVSDIDDDVNFDGKCTLSYGVHFDVPTPTFD